MGVMMGIEGSSSPLRILFYLAGDQNKASSRVRGYWVAEELEARGHEVAFHHVKSKAGYFRLAARLWHFDVLVIQKAYGRYDPWIMRLAKALGLAVFFDIDDAPSRVSSSRVERAARTMMQGSHGVFAGCSALVELSEKVQPETHLVPSAIRLATYAPLTKHDTEEPVTLGWIGNGAHYTDDLISVLAPALRTVAAQTPLRFRIVGACAEPRLYETFTAIPGLDADLVDGIEWSDAKAVNAEIAQFDVGLYPLARGAFNDFKCGFKALEYMAMGLPVLASDAANHSEIVVEGETGYLLRSEEEWTRALTRLIQDSELRSRMGQAGRARVMSSFTTALIARDLEEYFLRERAA